MGKGNESLILEESSEKKYKIFRLWGALMEQLGRGEGGCPKPG